MQPPSDPLETLGERLVTLKRARAYAAIVALVLTLTYASGLVRGHGLIDGFGHVVGGDLLTLRTAAQLVRDGNGDRLYDFDLQARYQQQAVRPAALPGLNPFISPPFVALVYAPWSLLPQGVAFALWTVLAVAALALSLALAAQRGGLDRRAGMTALLVSLSFFPVLEGLMAGNSSTIALLCLTGVYLALKERRDGLAGALLGLQLVKPQLVVVLLLILAGKRRWRALVGTGVVALAWIALGALFVGAQSLEAYLVLLPRLSRLAFVDGFPSSLLSSLYAFFLLPFGPNLFAAAMIAGTLASLAVLGTVLRAWSGPWDPASDRFDLQFAIALVATCLVGQYVQLHDLTILILTAVLVAGRYLRPDRLAIARKGWGRARLALAGVWVIGLVGPLLAFGLHVQLVPVAVLFLGWSIWEDLRALRRSMAWSIDAAGERPRVEVGAEPAEHQLSSASTRGSLEAEC